MKTFKPQLLPNNKAGEAPDWENLISNPNEFLFSCKLDGARVEIAYDAPVLGRSLKSLSNTHIQRMGDEFKAALGVFGGVFEAEFYSPNMNFSEIMHFFKTADVTSVDTYDKYVKLWNKTGGDSKLGWPYPGRTVEWLTTWHDCLKFYVFDYYLQDSLTKQERTDMYIEACATVEDYCNHMVPIFQAHHLEHIDQVYQMFDQSLIDGFEGVVAIRKDAPYKCGRHTLNSKMAFKIKDDNLEYDGVILSVEEATEAREGSEKTINELGRSVTSKLKEDRIPSGLAKGFLVRMEDGNELVVTFKGYDHPALRELLNNAADYVGQTIRFTGMAPVKEGGCPRHARFTAGNFRDAK